MKNTDVIISHYNESLDWLKTFDHPNLRYIWVYSKSQNLFYGHQLNDKIIHQYYPNYGDDGLTHLNHIVHHYDNLSENIIFMQSDLNPHIRVNNEWCTTTCNKTKVSEFIDWLQHNDYTNNYQLTEIWDCLSLSGTNGGCDKWFVTGTCEHLQNCLNDNPQQDCKVHLKGKMDIVSYLNRLTRAEIHLYEWAKQRLNLNTEMYPPRCVVPVFWGTTIGLKSKQITTRPKSLYQEIIDKDYAIIGDNIHVECGHYLERTVYFLFNLHELDQHKFSVKL
jgi:hypothetical protein